MNLTQRVSLTTLLLLLTTNIIVGITVSQVIRQSYLDEQKRSIAQSVQRLANRFLSASDFQTANIQQVQTKFDHYRDEITTPDTVRIKIYSRDGTVLSSDQTELIGQKLFTDEPEELTAVLNGQILGNISRPDKSENQYEQGFTQLLEVYVPIVFDDVNVSGVVETYTQLSSLNRAITRSQIYAVSLTTVVISLAFIILYLIVRNASRTLIRQDIQLQLDIKKERQYSSLKDEFISLSSHQLRTPASAIKWSLETLMQELGHRQLTPAQREALDGVRVNTESLISIINNLLIISDIKPDYFTYEAHAYSVSELIRESIQKHQILTSQKKQRISFTPDTLDTKTLIKRPALLIVINTLIKNATDYSPEGGEITINQASSPDAIRIEVIDSGIGIPKDEQPKVFDKFFRASNSIKQKNAGSGLSLHIAKQIIAGYQGSLEFTALASGSKFTLELPTINHQ